MADGIKIETLGEIRQHEWMLLGKCLPCNRTVALDLDELIAQHGADYSIPANYDHFVRRLECKVCKAKLAEITLLPKSRWEMWSGPRGS